MRRHLWLVVLAAMAACSDATVPLPSTVGPPTKATASAGPAAASFIIVLAPKVDPRAVADDHGIEPAYTYRHVLTGFAGRISDLARQGLLKDERVVAIRRDQPFAADASEPAASWGLDRIDQRRGTDGRYTYAATGAGVTAYIVDTGIRYSHSDFGGRASFGYDAFGGDGSDCSGHGTHVAGTVGGATHGVAKRVHLVSVRVLDCSGYGTTSSVLAGLDWVLANAVRPAVANLSFGGDPDQLLDDAVRRLYHAGMLAAVAAGNNEQDACGFSPSRVAEAVTVGATNFGDERVYFSNYGDCVDLFAPGLAITSDWFTNDTAVTALNGTSMAAPHVTGAAALYLQAHPTALASDVATALAAASTKHIVRSSGSTNNDMVYTLSDSVSDAMPLPVASFGAACSGLTCAFTDASAAALGSVASWRWDFGDGAASNAKDPVHGYGSAGTYTVTLTITDSQGATALTSRTITVGSPAIANQPPEPAFTFSCTRLTCSFVDRSTDADGAVARVQWDFGDGSGALATAASSGSHTYSAGASYAVSLTATDNAGAAQSTVQQVPVGIRITLATHRQKGRMTVDIAWQGAESSQVDVFANDRRAATVAAAAGAYTYLVSGKGQVSVTIRVCEAGSGYCSRSATISM